MNSSQSPVLFAARAAETHWYADGLENIYRGLLLLLLSVDFFLPVPSPNGSLYGTVAPFFSLGGLIMFGVLILSHRTIIEWIKAKLTVPRIGYVAPPPSAVGVERHDTGFWPAPLPTFREEEYLDRQQRMRIWTYAFVILLFLVGFLGFRGALFDRLVILGWALFFGVASKYTQPPGRSAWIALIVCVLSGIAVVLIGFPRARPAHLLFPLLGGISALVGVFQLAAFLIRHPRPKQSPS